MTARFSQRLSSLTPSPVREILRAATGRAVISLAGGLPAEETFPELPGLPRGWEQYGLTEGDLSLRQAISRHLEGRGLACPPERILVLNGSQQGLDLAAKLFVDPGTPVLCESPTYVAALQVFRFFGAALHGLPLEAKGPAPEAIAPLAAARDPHLAYLIPNYQNPTGAVWSEAAREEFARVADAREMAVLEDDPYGEIGFGQKLPKPICSRLRRASWMYQSSFSKSFVPGLRLGFLAASEDLFVYLERLKQAADLHSNRLSQALVRADLSDPARPARLDAVRAEYRRRRDAFADSLSRHFPKAEFHAPEGGLFFWARLSRTLDLRAVAPQAMAEGIAFLPGEHCFAGDPELGWARFNFSHEPAERADKALARLSQLVAQAEG